MFISTNSQYAPYMAGPSDNGAWWMPLLEKAYAKFVGTFAGINAGNGWEALRALTGMPVAHYTSMDYTAGEILDIIQDGDERHYVMYAGCHFSQYGLVAGHAYSVLGVNSEEDRIIVRNPWGAELYTGPGSD